MQRPSPPLASRMILAHDLRAPGPSVFIGAIDGGLAVTTQAVQTQEQNRKSTDVLSE